MLKPEQKQNMYFPFESKQERLSTPSLSPSNIKNRYENHKHYSPHNSTPHSTDLDVSADNELSLNDSVQAKKELLLLARNPLSNKTCVDCGISLSNIVQTHLSFIAPFHLRAKSGDMADQKTNGDEEMNFDFGVFVCAFCANLHQQFIGRG